MSNRAKRIAAAVVLGLFTAGTPALAAETEVQITQGVVVAQGDQGVVVQLGAAAVPELPYPGFKDASTSETQYIDHSEEHGLPRIPIEDAIDQSAACSNNLTRDVDEGADERLEVHPQHAMLLLLVSLAPASWLLRKRT